MVEIVGFEPESPTIVGFEPDTGFASGTRQRMSEYQGLSPEQASGKAREELGKTLLGAAQSAAKLVNPIQFVQEVARSPEKIAEIAKAIPGLPRYYYQNPDVFATDVAAIATPLGPVKKGAEAVEAMRPSVYDIEGVPFTRADVPEAPASVQTPLQRAQAIKYQAGAEMKAAKEENSVPAETVKPLVSKIESDIAETHDPGTHTSTNWIMGRLKKLLPEEEKPAFYPPRSAKLQAKIDEAERKQGGLFDPTKLNAKIKEALGQQEKEPVTLQKLHFIQQALRDSLSSRWLNERESAVKIKDNIDNFVENEMGTPGWTASKRRYAVASAALEMKGLVERALYRKTQLSGDQKAAALATEFRNWAKPDMHGRPNKNMRMLRGISPETADKVAAFGKGELPFDRLLKILGTASPSNLMNVGLAEIAGHMLHGILGAGGPGAIMVTGAAARYLRGVRAEANIDKIINELLDEGEIKEDSLQKVIGPKAVDTIKTTVDGKHALSMWKKKATRGATRALAIAIARAANMPQLTPRIEQEINQIEPVSDNQ